MSDILDKKFIKATENYCTLDRSVPAPLMRRKFTLGKFDESKLYVCGLGFYRLFINGEEITDGALCGGVYNPDDRLLYDEYDVTNVVREGENAIGVILGNGFLNNVGGGVWRLDRAEFRDAPKLALRLTADGETAIEADESFKVAPSAIRFDDMRYGEEYDAREEIDGWSEPSFDDGEWKNALPAAAPKGEFGPFRGERIRFFEELKPKKIYEIGKGRYVYDFGACASGVCRLRIKGERGKRITLRHSELTDERGIPYQTNISFPQSVKSRVQRIDYVCKGGEDVEEYLPSFTYFCFRYVTVEGIDGAEATDDLLTFCVMHAAVNRAGGFSCSDETANKVQSMVLASDLSNLFHFLNDCSHREKNGWTADVSLSIEQILLNFDARKIFKDWYVTFVAAQREDGAVPCIAPTTGYGFNWGNGPAWDSALAFVPYYLYKYYGDDEIVRIAAPALVKYVGYLKSIRKPNGLIEKGLSDWCEVTNDDRFHCSTKLETASTLISIDIAKKATFVFSLAGEEYSSAAAEAEELRKELVAAFRKERVYSKACRVRNFTQFDQATAIAFGVFTDEEKPRAAKQLVDLITRQGEKMLFGVWGSRYVFRALADCGYCDLAWKMIVRTDEKSYGYMADRDWNTLWEKIVRTPRDMRFKYSYRNRCTSYNHHFWGDVSAFFIRYVCGIHVNPSGRDSSEVVVKPRFVKGLSSAQADYDTVKGKITVAWRSDGGEYYLDATYPEGLSVKIEADGAIVTETVKKI